MSYIKCQMSYFIRAYAQLRMPYGKLFQTLTLTIAPMMDMPVCYIRHNQIGTVESYTLVRVDGDHCRMFGCMIAIRPMVLSAGCYWMIFFVENFRCN